MNIIYNIVIVCLVLGTSSLSKTHHIWDYYPDGVVPRSHPNIHQNEHPVLQLSNIYGSITTDWRNLTFSPCKFYKIVDTLSHVGDNLHLDYFNLNVSAFNSLLFECKTITRYKLPTKIDLHIANNFESVQNAMDVVTTTNQHSGGVYSVKTIYFKNDLPSEDLSTDYFWTFMNKQNVNVGCSTDMPPTFNSNSTIYDIIGRCRLVLQRSPLLLLNWPYGTKSYDHMVSNDAFLHAYNIRLEFRDFYFNGEIVLQPNIKDAVISSNSFMNEKVNIYCTQRLAREIQYNGIIKSWTQFLNFTLNVGSVIDAEERGMWYNVYTDSELNRTATDFEVLVRRNVPKTIEPGLEFPFKYPCLHYTDNPKSSIEFDTNKLVGISFESNLKMKSLPTSGELQTLLLYCFGRFSSVEMRNYPYKLLDALSGVFTSEFSDAIEPQFDKVGNVKLYLEIDGIKSLNLMLNKIPNYASKILIDLHLFNWERYSFEKDKQINSVVDSFFNKETASLNINFGLSVKNCLQEINSNFTKITALSYYSFVNYLVCDVKPVLPTTDSKDSMQTFLDTNFYVQQYVKVKLGLDVIFRLNFVPNKFEHDKTGIENYLRFLYDTNQHAKTYEIKYFMGEAFNRHGNKFEWSWWQIFNTKDLTNDAVYTELESGYFNRETKRKLRVIPTVVTNHTLLIVLSIMFSFLIGTIFAVLIYCRRIRNRFLTKSEMYAFRRGVIMSDCTDDVDLYDIRKHEADTQPFTIHFEILKDSIKCGSVVGRGNFGIVYKATLKNTDTVAVKTPAVGCSKEIFKTMLAEVKVLCYIGSHSNVLRFRGAYTQEIEKGFIYIVTEFCEMGSLDKYLRSRKVTNIAAFEASNEDESSMGYVANANVSQTVGMNDLYRFSYEIANGMNYLARRKVIHADLSTRNVLLTEELVCKIGDFGLSRKLYNKDKYVKQSEEELPWKWMAVESLKKLEFTTKSDVWSFGVTLWEIFTLGDIPYHGIRWTEDFNQKLENGLRLSKPPLASEETYGKMLQCWNISPDRRPQFFTLSSYFFKKLG